VGGPNPFKDWYKPDAAGAPRLSLPNDPEQKSIRLSNLVLHPDRPKPIAGNIQGQDLEQYDLTPQQYDSLIKLTATLCTLFPKIRCDYPKDASGKLIPLKLDEAAYRGYQGILGHYHVQRNKVDPGPAFQWDRVIDGARALMK
jgi:hypothetical protein